MTRHGSIFIANLIRYKKEGLAEARHHRRLTADEGGTFNGVSCSSTSTAT
jgi:hypothetical protein